MAQNEEYFNAYMGLLYELERAYNDIDFLETVDEFKDKKLDNSQPCFRVINHFCELAMADLGLTVYKISFDNSKSTNSIKHFNSLSHKNGSNKSVKIKFSNELNALEKPLRELRNTYLSHADVNPTTSSVDTADLIKAVNEIAEYLSKIADENIDDRINTKIYIPRGKMKINNTIGAIQILNLIKGENEDV